MNLETKLDPRLWDAIRASYENRNFTGAILDAMYFLSDLVRERTGLESDGVALVGQAFGGNAPKLKVSPLQTESDWNLQKELNNSLGGCTKPSEILEAMARSPIAKMTHRQLFFLLTT